jgi:hypothetical protein
MNTKVPVTIDGWYELTDETVVKISWSRRGGTHGGPRIVDRVQTWEQAAEVDRLVLISGAGKSDDLLYREECKRAAVEPYSVKVERLEIVD